MTKRIPWYELEKLKPINNYIETPFSGYIGNKDKVIWPWFLVVLLVGTFIATLTL